MGTGDNGELAGRQVRGHPNAGSRRGARDPHDRVGGTRIEETSPYLFNWLALLARLGTSNSVSYAW